MLLKDLTYDEVRHLFDYNAVTGVMTRRVACGSRGKLGATVGSKSRNGALVVNIKSKLYMVHRLIWLWVYEEWPSMWIDHIDGDPSNNRLCNLRECTPGENQQNQKNRAGRLLGAQYRRGGWIARIKRQGQTYYLGNFPTEREAHEAYLAAKARLHTFNPVPRE